MLRDYGVDAVQGLHIGEPEPAHDLERLVVPEEAEGELTSSRRPA
jgi:EAL domain-containing protein (putative c-di-GMP-specific phosphodiesterase class I)